MNIYYRGANEKVSKNLFIFNDFSFNINVLAENGQEEGTSEVTGASSDATLTDVYIMSKKLFVVIMFVN